MGEEEMKKVDIFKFNTIFTIAYSLLFILSIAFPENYFFQSVFLLLFLLFPIGSGVCSENLIEVVASNLWNAFLFFITVLSSYLLVFNFSLLENSPLIILLYFVVDFISIFTGVLSFYFKRAKALFIFMPFILLIFFMFLYFYTQNLNIDSAIEKVIEWIGIPKRWLQQFH
jgi:hypothetical protein